MKPEEGIVGTPKFGVSEAEVWVSWGPHLQLASEWGNLRRLSRGVSVRTELIVGHPVALEN